MTTHYSTPNTESGSGSRTWTSVLRLLTSRSTVLLLAAALLVLYFEHASGGIFVTATNASLLLRQTAVVAVAAAGIAILIIMGEIDLSIGSSAFLTGLVAAQCQVAGWGVAPSVMAAVGTGIALGFVQGLVITRLALPAFVVTLAGLLLWRGIGLMWTDAAAIGPVSPEFADLTEGRMSSLSTTALAALVVAYGLWSAYRRYTSVKQEQGNVAITPILAAVAASTVLAGALLWIGAGRTGLPNAILWIAVIVIVLGFALSRAKFGRRVYLVGSNREAAMYAGISVNRIVLLGFIIMGAIYGIAGTMLIARVGTSTADSGINLELTAIAAAVIGGVSLRGGIGSIVGALLGAFLLSTIDNGMSLLGVSSYAENVVKALILVFAVGLDGYFTRRQQIR
ncbi:sugar ABC transporter permease [Paraburkholderia sp. RCC_158]|uniref:sugar ABC transporter permease n=1 Tax=Paraburkholderia sp. RCC_158 TaxID=3239220 RepID=UPI0035234E54